MAKAHQSDPVKLICGMISASDDTLDRAAKLLVGQFGPTDIVSDIMNFDFTHYYDQQMGSPLHRQFVAFERLALPGDLAEAKCRTNELEEQFARQVRAADPAAPPRPVNLDVGYVCPAKLVLASMKDFSHRVYLDRGVYGEVTLMYHSAGWQSLPWTFPDYASGRYDAFLIAARDLLPDRGRLSDATEVAQ